MLHNSPTAWISTVAVITVTGAARLCYGQAGRATTDDRALALLRAVEAARLDPDFSSGTLNLMAAYKEGTVDSTHRFAVSFDDIRRRFLQTDGPVRRGAIINEEDSIRFDGVNSCTLDAPVKVTSDYCFDPRILGATANFSERQTVERCFPYREAKAVTFVGLERFKDLDLSHLQVEDVYGQRHDYWIEDSEWYPVHKYEFRVKETALRTECTSTYRGACPIPVDVQLITYNERNGDVVGTRRFILEDEKYGEMFSPETWGLSGLNMKVGTTVSDLRLKKRIGYWDGEKLSPFPPSIVEGGERLQESAAGARRTLILLNIFVLIVLTVILFFRRSRRRAN